MYIIISRYHSSCFTGAKKAREVVYSVLADACADGDLSINEAIEAVKDIFSNNAIQFYKIKIPTKPFGSKNCFSPTSVELKTNALTDDIALVRVIWVDASGQHRCRVSYFCFCVL